MEKKKEVTAKMGEDKEFTAKFEGIEAMNLSQSMVNLASINMPTLRAKKGELRDEEIIQLAEKARKYVNLLLDQQIKKLEK